MSEEHGPSLNTYLAIFVALLALTGLTVAVAFVDLGPLGAPVAVGIACLKATLVVLFFMHVKYESRLIGLWAASGIAFFIILVAITFAELSGRHPQPDDILGPPMATPTPAASSHH